MDVAFIKKCQQGNPDDFELLYHTYVKKAMGTAYLISGNKEIAEDIVQEAFIKCFKNIVTLKNPETFDVWFYKIVVRTAWRFQSSYKRAYVNLGVK